MQVPFAIESYKSRSAPWSAQRCINGFSETAPNKNTKTPNVVYGSPGISSFTSGLSGSIRGSKLMGGVLYVVAGSGFYSIASDGTATSIGSINTNFGLVSMDANLASPQQLCFVDGTDGWIYDTTNGLQQIVDADFQAADTVTFQDGYFIFNWNGTANFFISNLNNGLAYTATDYAAAEATPDNTVAVYSSQQQLWVFKELSFEVFYNSGNPDFPFERISGGVQPRGLAAAFTLTEDDNTLFFLGNDRIFYRANGFTPVRISTHAIEEELRKMSDVSDAYSYFITLSGHKFFYTVFPTGNACFVFDVSTGLWHERESYGKDYFLGIAYSYAYNKHIIGDAFQGRLGELDLDSFTEFSNPMLLTLTAPNIAFGRARIPHHKFEIEMETGVGNASETDPMGWIDWSDDGGRTWSDAKPPANIGKVGEYIKRLRWTRLGSPRQRIYRFQTSSAVKKSVLGAYLNEDLG